MFSFFSPHKNSKTGRLQDCKLHNVAAKGKKQHETIPYGGEQPLPMPQAPALNWRTLLMDRHLSSEQQRCWLQGTQINPKCASAHTRSYFQSQQLTFTTFQVHN